MYGSKTALNLQDLYDAAIERQADLRARERMIQLFVQVPSWKIAAVSIDEGGFVVICDPDGKTGRFTPTFARGLAELLWEKADEASK